MALAAIRVRNGEIVQRAGRANGVSITPADNGFILHGALGPAPDRWVQSPDDAVIGWSPVDDGIRIWTTHPEPTIRFVPDIEQEPDEEGNEPEPLPEPDWSRVLDVKAALRRQVDAIRDQMIDSGVTSNGITYQTRATDRENVAGAFQLATLAASQGQPFETQWIAMDNTVHTLDLNGIVALGQAIADRKAELIFRGRQVKDAVNAAESFDALPDIEALMADDS